MGLLADNGRIVSGSIIFDGEEISPISEKYKNNKKAYEKRMQEIRGNDIGMIFQDPMTFLNPILKVGTQIEEQILRHTKCSKKEARERAIELMKKSRNTKSGKENRPVSVPVFRWYETTNYHSDCTFMQS